MTFARAAAIVLFATLVAAPAAAQQRATICAGCARRAFAPARTLQYPAAMVPRTDFADMSKYVGWGGAIGVAAGAVYGLAAAPAGSARGMEIVGDAAIGFGTGMLAGALWFFIHHTGPYQMKVR